MRLVDVHLVSTGSDRWEEPATAVQRKRLALQTAMCPVTVVAYRRPGATAPRVPGVTFVLASASLPPGLRQAARLAAAVRAIVAATRRASHVVVMAQSPWDAAAALAARRLCRVLGRDVAVAVEVHGDWIEVSHLLGRFPRWTATALRAFSRAVLARADVVRTVSVSTTRLVARFADRPVVTFPAFTDLDPFLAEGRRPARRRHLLYAGVLTPVKNVGVLLEAVAAIRDLGHSVGLVVAGDGPERAALEARAAHLGLGAAVAFRGHVDQPALAALMRDAWAVVLPSFSEGLARVVVEAFACGTPVVVSDVGGLAEVVQDGVNGRLVPPGDAAALATALTTLVARPQVVDAMGRAGRELVATRFTERAWADGQRRLLAVALGRPETAAGQVEDGWQRVVG